MEPINQFIGQALKQQRQQRCWSLDRMATSTGVSKTMLGQIERGESSPTVATLWKIATGLQVSLSTLLEPQLPNLSVQIRSAAQLRQQPARDNMLVATLFPYDAHFGFEWLELTILPQYERISDPHAQGVIEHISVIQGEMQVLIENEWLNLSAGDAIRFAADKRHGYRNIGVENCVFHNLIHYPD